MSDLSGEFTLENKGQARYRVSSKACHRNPVLPHSFVLNRIYWILR